MTKPVILTVDDEPQVLNAIERDLLDDRAVTIQLPYQAIRVLGTLWSPDSNTMKDFLSRNQNPYQWMDVEKDEDGKRLLDALNGRQTFPVAVFPDGDVRHQSIKRVASAVGEGAVDAALIHQYLKTV